jgi:hypothetical protein
VDETAEMGNAGACPCTRVAVLNFTRTDPTVLWLGEGEKEWDVRKEERETWPLKRPL